MLTFSPCQSKNTYACANTCKMLTQQYAKQDPIIAVNGTSVFRIAICIFWSSSFLKYYNTDGADMLNAPWE